MSRNIKSNNVSTCRTLKVDFSRNKLTDESRVQFQTDFTILNLSRTMLRRDTLYLQNLQRFMVHVCDFISRPQAVGQGPRGPVAAPSHQTTRAAQHTAVEVPHERESPLLDVAQHVPGPCSAGRQTTVQRLPAEAVFSPVLRLGGHCLPLERGNSSVVALPLSVHYSAASLRSD